MRLTLSPGYVYICYSKYRPKDVKIGKALDTEEREFTLSLGDPDLKIHKKLHFLDVFAAEAHMHGVFAKNRIGREHFEVSRTKASDELSRYFESRQAEQHAFEACVRGLVDRGELKLDTSSQVDECTGSALSSLLAHVPSIRDGRNVKALIALALAGGIVGDKAATLLLGCGLLAYPVEGIVLLDKSMESSLELTFKKKQCQKTWREQVARFAGFNSAGRSVGLQDWIERTEAGQELVDLVSPLRAPARRESAPWLDMTDFPLTVKVSSKKKA